MSNGFTEDDAITTVRDSSASRSRDGAEGLGDPKPGAKPGPELTSGGSLTIVFHDKIRSGRHYAARRSPARESKVLEDPAQVLAGC
jgi:hypothetical protein